MVNTEAHPWFYPEIWPEEWRPCVDAVRSGVCIVLPDETRLELTLKPHHKTQLTPLKFSAVYNDTPITLAYTLETWQTWTQHWLQIESVDSLPHTLKQAAFAMTLEPLAQLLSSLECGIPSIIDATPSVSKAPYVCLHVQKPEQPHLHLTIQGLSPDIVLKLCTFMQPVITHTEQRITFPLAVGWCFPPEGSIHTIAPQSVFFFEQPAQIAEREMYLILPQRIITLRLDDDDTCVFLAEQARIENKATSILYAYAGEASFATAKLTWAEIGGAIALKTTFYNSIECIKGTEKQGLGRIVRFGEKTGLQMLTSSDVTEHLSGHS